MRAVPNFDFEGNRCLLGALVRMMDNITSMPPLQRYVLRIDHQLDAQMLRDRHGGLHPDRLGATSYGSSGRGLELTRQLVGGSTVAHQLGDLLPEFRRVRGLDFGIADTPCSKDETSTKTGPLQYKRRMHSLNSIKNAR